MYFPIRPNLKTSYLSIKSIEKKPQEVLKIRQIFVDQAQFTNEQMERMIFDKSYNPFKKKGDEAGDDADNSPDEDTAEDEVDH